MKITKTDDLIPLYVKYAEPLGIRGEVMFDIISKLPNYVAFGYYKDNKLIAFIDGFDLTKDVVRLNIIYNFNSIATGAVLLKLYRELETYIKNNNYIGWHSMSTLTTQNIVEKLGANKWE